MQASPLHDRIDQRHVYFDRERLAEEEMVPAWSGCCRHCDTPARERS
jgi:hypothetical protein